MRRVDNDMLMASDTAPKPGRIGDVGMDEGRWRQWWLWGKYRIMRSTKGFGVLGIRLENQRLEI